MERPIFKPIGTPAAQLDTPALVVDLALVEQHRDVARLLSATGS